MNSFLKLLVYCIKTVKTVIILPNKLILTKIYGVSYIKKNIWFFNSFFINIFSGDARAPGHVTS